jgi:predicted DsbA family dithiol-disulfide isomerase
VAKVLGMKIDVISDTICPWCYIGKRRLDRALAARPDLDIKVYWRPFRLDPALPTEGVDRKEYLRRKFGDTPKSRLMAAALRDAGEREGIVFNFDAIQKTPNSLDSHRLIRWASSTGQQNVLVEKLFLAYFTQGRDIGDRAVLAAIAGECGMDAELVQGLLDSDADLDRVEAEDGLARKVGIEGVPTFFFAGNYLLSGAEETQTLLNIIDRIAALSGEAAAHPPAAE